jgi:hypothetical protein
MASTWYDDYYTLLCVLKTSVHLPAVQGNEIQYKCLWDRYQFSNNVVPMCIVTLPFHLHTLPVKSWCAHNVYAYLLYVLEH